MQELYKDNVQFIEIRTPFPSLYELNGYQHNPIESVKLCKKVESRYVIFLLSKNNKQSCRNYSGIFFFL